MSQKTVFEIVVKTDEIIDLHEKMEIGNYLIEKIVPELRLININPKGVTVDSYSRQS